MPAPAWWKEDPEKSWQAWMELQDEYSQACRISSNIEFERDWMLGHTSFGVKGLPQIPGFPNIPHPEYPDNGESIEKWNAWIVQLQQAMKPKPTVVCLCGSTRFMDAFFEAGWRETLEGKIVLSIGVCKHAEDHGGEALGPHVAAMLDELHLRKIGMSDEVLILNVGGYIGESTRAELEYARENGKRIRFLEPEKEAKDT